MRSVLLDRLFAPVTARPVIGPQPGRLIEKASVPVAAERVISGHVEYYGSQPQMPHPDHVVAPEQAEKLKAIEPVYPLTAGLSSRVVSRAVAAALERAPELAEWLDPALRQRQHW